MPFGDWPGWTVKPLKAITFTPTSSTWLVATDVQPPQPRIFFAGVGYVNIVESQQRARMSRGGRAWASAADAVTKAAASFATHEARAEAFGDIPVIVEVDKPN